MSKYFINAHLLIFFILKIFFSFFFSQNSINKVPHFMISGELRSAVCEINKPFMGELVVEESSAPIRSIELQLVRVETCGCADGFAKEGTLIFYTSDDWSNFVY